MYNVEGESYEDIFIYCFKKLWNKYDTISFEGDRYFCYLDKDEMEEDKTIHSVVFEKIERL